MPALRRCGVAVASSRFVNMHAASETSDILLQSVFLEDITAAYQKNTNLESLLFDDFFNKGHHKLCSLVK